MSNIKQLAHHETLNESFQFPIVVVCENFHSPQNVGMAFRVCEIMGIQHLHLTGTSPTPPGKKIAKTSRTADKKVPYSYHKNSTSILSQLKKEDYTLIGLEITNQSKDIRTFDFSKYPKIALVLGAENYGISDATLDQLDQTIQIPMFGQLTSLNVVSALSIGLYEIVKQYSGRQEEKGTRNIF